MIAGLLVPFGIVLGGMGYGFKISLYGFETMEPLSFKGIFLIILLLTKAVTGYGLWTGKNWAVDLGIFDAVIGLLVCVAALVVLPWIDTTNGLVSKFRLDFIILIIYLLRLQKIKPFWTAE